MIGPKLVSMSPCRAGSQCEQLLFFINISVCFLTLIYQGNEMNLLYLYLCLLFVVFPQRSASSSLVFFTFLWWHFTIAIDKKTTKVWKYENSLM